MTDRRNWLLPLGLALLGVVFLGFDIGGRAISSPTEARYVEIPMGMLATGDFVVPRLNGIIYFEKPPLFYWLQAAALHAFGVTEWSARLVNAIFAIFGFLATGIAAWRFYGRETACAAAVILMTSIYFYINGRAIQTDMVVSVFVVATMFLFIAGAVESERHRQVWLLRGAYLAAALAVLSKGLIGIVLPGMVAFAWIALTAQWRLIPKLLIPSGLLLFFVITVPWHVAAAMRNDDFLWFYFVHEHYIRFTTTEHGRAHPFWFFIPILLIGFLPWSGDMIAGFMRALPKSRATLRTDPVTLFLVLWSVLLFGFFSVSGSKLIPYILPIFPPLAILAGRVVGPGFAAGRGGTALGRWIFVGAFGLIGLALLVLPHIPKVQAKPDFAAVYGAIAPHIAILAAVFLLSAILVAILSIRNRLAMTIPVMMVAAILGMTTLSLTLSRVSPNTVKPLALMIKEKAQSGDVVASLGTFFYDLPVYLGRPVVVVDSMAEFHFGATQEDISAIVISRDELWRRWAGPERIYMLARTSEFDNWPDDLRKQVYVIGRTDRAVALTNRPPADRPGS